MAVTAPQHACSLPCEGCDDAVEALRRRHDGLDLQHSDEDGCWVVRAGFAEKLRSDSPCLACSYFRNKSQLLAS